MPWFQKVLWLDEFWVLGFRFSLALKGTENLEGDLVSRLHGDFKLVLPIAFFESKNQGVLIFLLAHLTFIISGVR